MLRCCSASIFYRARFGCQAQIDADSIRLQFAGECVGNPELIGQPIVAFTEPQRAQGDIVQKGVMVALVSAALFGVSTPLAKVLVGTVSPLLLAGLLYSGSGLGLSLLLAARRGWTSRESSLSLPGQGDWKWLAGAIFLGGVMAPVALTYGLVTALASTTSLLLNLEAAFTALLAWFLFHENFDRRVMSGMFCIVAGGLVLAWTPGSHGDASPGMALIVLACLCWAIDNNLTRRVSAGDAMLIAGLKGLVAGGVNLGLGLLLGQRLPSIGVLSIALSVGFLGYGVSLALFVRAMRDLGTARAGAYFSVAPFFGAALALLMQGDSITFQLVAAGLLMATGVFLHVTEHHGHRHVHEPQQHAHAHSHDEHHQHFHDFDWDRREPHTHPHFHTTLVHTHPHYPDVHHRHPH
jgi:drug/metabolite transporter (DMT)-like permease